MTILRPAIYALHGRQKLKMSGYSMVELTGDYFVKFGWFEVHSSNDRCYKARVINDTVEHLATGKLNV